MKLTAKDKILLHCLLKECFEERKLSYWSTQYGIAEGTNILRSHLPRNLKKLVENKMVKEVRVRIKGLERSRKGYLLTNNGISKGREVLETAMAMSLNFRDERGKLKEVKFCKIAEKLKKELDLDFLDLIKCLTPDNLLDYKELVRLKRGKFVDFSALAPKPLHFYGREKELEQIKNMLKTRKIIVIKGIAGIGKSAVLAKIMESVRSEKNVFWYTLHEWDTLRSVAEALSNFLTALGKKRLGAYLESKIINLSELGIILAEDLKEKPLLIALDDLQNASKELIDLLVLLRETINRLDDVTLLVAGRYIPYFYNARHILRKVVEELQLKGLDRKGARKLVAELNEKEFERAYELTQGHPLSLELISSGKGLEKVRDVMKYLYQEVYRRLEPEEKKVLAQVAVHRQAVPRDAILGDGISHEVIDKLVEKSLLLESYQATIWLHELLREFFYSRLSQQERITYHLKAARYYEGEKAGLEAIYHYLKSNKLEHAVKLVIKRGSALINKGYSEELLELFYFLDEKMVEERRRAKLLALKGDAHHIAGNVEEALKCYNSSLTIFKKLADEKAMIKGYLKIGYLNQARGDWENAMNNFRKALALSSRKKYIEGIAEAYHGIGIVYSRTGKSKNALTIIEKGIEYAREAEAFPTEAKLWELAGSTYISCGRYDQAINSIRKSVEKQRDKYRLAIAYCNLGVSYWHKRNFEKALEYYKLSVKHANRLGAVRIAGYAYLGISWCWVGMRAHGKAANYCDRAAHIFTAVKDKYGIASYYECYGNVLSLKKNWESAKEYFEKSIKISKELGSPDRLADTYYGLAKMYKEKGDFKKARVEFQRALDYYIKLNNKEKIKELKKEVEKIKNTANHFSI